LPKWSIPTQKIDIDNNTRFRYQVGYWCPLIDALICDAKADADTQLIVFDSSALKKQLLIFKLKEVYGALRRRMQETVPKQGAYLRSVLIKREGLARYIFFALSQ
jgi:hypothetical protein